MGRELRRVPKNWDHPKNEDGQYVSLSENYLERVSDWVKMVNDFSECVNKIEQDGVVIRYGKEICSFKDLHEWFDGELDAPDPKDYMPSGDWYQSFQNVSEGTPISPPFETSEELVDWMSNNLDYWGTQWTREGAQHLVNGGYVPSAVAFGGKIHKAQDSYKVLGSESI